VALRVWLHRDRASLLLDTSGESLDHRGYRRVTSAAPVREQLAAACVLASGWDGSGPVVDPMCGSGTLLAEAAAWALGLAPGRCRPGFGFERLPGFDPAKWLQVRREQIPAAGPGVRLHGVDRSPTAIAAARENLEAAGLGDRAQLTTGDADSFDPPRGPGLVVVNPAHGERLAEEQDQWPRLGDLLKHRYTGWRAVVLAGGPSRGRHIGLKPRSRIPVKNGPLDARILVFELY
jgi:putative N6-adenine-specific DNA methylase